MLSRWAHDLLNRLKVDAERLESSMLFQPNLIVRPPPKVIRPSPAIQYLAKMHEAVSKS